MGDMRKAIYDDEQDYERLCKHFGESSGPGPYSDHAKLLARMKKEENELHQKHKEQLRLRFDALAKLTPAEQVALGLKA